MREELQERKRGKDVSRRGEGWTSGGEDGRTDGRTDESMDASVPKCSNAHFSLLARPVPSLRSRDRVLIHPRQYLVGCCFDARVQPGKRSRRLFLSRGMSQTRDTADRSAVPPPPPRCTPSSLPALFSFLGFATRQHGYRDAQVRSALHVRNPHGYRDGRMYGDGMGWGGMEGEAAAAAGKQPDKAG